MHRLIRYEERFTEPTDNQLTVHWSLLGYTPYNRPFFKSGMLGAYNRQPTSSENPQKEYHHEEVSTFEMI